MHLRSRLPKSRQGLLAGALMLVLWGATVLAQDARSTYTLWVDGLACPFCAYGVEKQLGAVPGVERVETDIRSGTLTVFVEGDRTLDEASARKAVEAAGFTLRDFKPGKTQR